MKKKKNKRIGSLEEDFLTNVLMDFSPAAGAIASHEIKTMIPASVKTSLGSNSDYIINAIGAASVVLPHLLGLKGESLQIARGLASGVSAECALAGWMKFRGQTAIGGSDNKSYSLAAAKEKLKYLRVNGTDNAAPGIMAASPAGNARGMGATFPKFQPERDYEYNNGL